VKAANALAIALDPGGGDMGLVSREFRKTPARGVDGEEEASHRAWAIGDG
jgi:hypothetical protein